MKGIKLNLGKVAFVDDEDYGEVAPFHWFAQIIKGYWYVKRNARDEHNRKISIYLHRQIMRAVRGQVVDHIDGNGLNCQRSNMRLCTQMHNTHNIRGHRDAASQFKGIYFRKHTNAWTATIMTNGKKHSLGSYDNEVDAAKAYDAAARFYNGQFAKTNFEGTDAFPAEVIRKQDVVHVHRVPKSAKGYCYIKRERRWIAYAQRHGIRKHLGTFLTEQEAKDAREKNS